MFKQTLLTIIGLSLACSNAHTSIRLEGRIVNGSRAETTNYPWITSLQWTQNGIEGRNVACTGSLIRSEYPAAILTAAHCCNAGILINNQYGYKYYGEVGRQYPYTTNPNDLYTSLRAFFFYNFKAYTQQQGGNTINALTDYDACVILLDGNVSNIDPITLYNPNNVEHTNKCCTEDQIVRSIGYGFIDNNRTETDFLRYIDMQYMSDINACSNGIINCLTQKDSSVAWTDIVPTDGSAVCAEITGGGICQGDSGCPLVYYDDNMNAIQIGVASQSCCIKGVPSMFASVGFFYEGIQWILSDDQWISYAPGYTTTKTPGGSSTSSTVETSDTGIAYTLDFMFGLLLSMCTMIYIHL